VQGDLYFRHFRQLLLDGNPSDVAPCTNNAGFFCSSGDNGTTYTVPVVDQNGNNVALTAVANPSYPAEIDTAVTDTDTIGGTAQFTSTKEMVGHSNQFVSGVSLDQATTTFNSSAQFGSFDSSRAVDATALFVSSPGTISPVSLLAHTTYGGVYLSDTFDFDKQWSLTVSARYNVAEIDMNDQLGGDLTGKHYYQRLNPSLGAAYKLNDAVTLFGDYAESNRIPTAAELSCADPSQSCSLAGFFVSDPDLAQVVARTFELGARGGREVWQGRVGWTAGLFTTTNSDDIIEISSPQAGKGYFQNAGTTLRQGAELGASYQAAHWQTFLDYSLVAATFQSALTIYSPNNPAADGNGNIEVASGDSIPNIPMHRVKLGATYAFTRALSAGANWSYVSSQFLHGDESNQNRQMPDYNVLNVHADYSLQKWLEAFVSATNVLNSRYYSFGVLTNSQGVPPGNQNLVRAFTPGEPFAVLAGVRAQL
jgi:iron complex outermembrane receptor protein